MNQAFWQKITKLPKFLETREMEPSELADRIRQTERNIVLPVKALVMVVLFYYLFYKNLIDDPASGHEVILEALQRFFLVCVMLNLGGASVLLTMDWLPFRVVQMSVFGIAVLDALFISGLTLAPRRFREFDLLGFPRLDRGATRSARPAPHIN